MSWTLSEEHRLRRRAACERAAAAWDRVAVAHERCAWVMHRLGRVEQRDQLLRAMVLDRRRSVEYRRRATTYEG